jgi:hypothetical protein
LTKLTPTEESIIFVLVGHKIDEIEKRLAVLSGSFYPDTCRILSSDLEQLKLIKNKLL